MSSSSFPTSLQDLDATRGSTGQPLSTPNHVTHHTLEDDTIEALEAKVGADSSAVTTSHDYKLSGVTGSDKAVSKTGVETLTNKTLTSPAATDPAITGTNTSISIGSDATGDLLVRNSSGKLQRLAAGTSAQVLTANGVGALPTYQTLSTVSVAQVQNEAYSYAADSGSANAYAITLASAPASYTAGQVFYFKATNANTTASTLNVNSLGVKSIVKNGSTALVANDILAGQLVTVAYDGTNFQMESPVGTSAAPQYATSGSTTQYTSAAQVSGTSTISKSFTLLVPGVVEIDYDFKISVADGVSAITLALGTFTTNVPSLALSTAGITTTYTTATNAGLALPPGNYTITFTNTNSRTVFLQNLLIKFTASGVGTTYVV
jgi:hypothetical protein